MTQQGTIKKLLPGGRAEVEVTRRSACGHDCAKCGGCGGLETQTLYVTARNHTDAGIGDRVLIEGESGRVLGLAALVYMLPLVLFFIGYAIGNAAGGGAAGALAGGVLFALGIIGAIFYKKTKLCGNRENDLGFRAVRGKTCGPANGNEPSGRMNSLNFL